MSARHVLALPSSLLALALAACTGAPAGDAGPGLDDDPACGAALRACDGGDGDLSDAGGDGDTPDAGQGDAGTGEPAILATESYEANVSFGWIAAGQPSPERLTDVVNQGARILSLRYENEETFGEQALVEGLGGVFLRYPTMGSDYNSVAFREGMYDLYDEQRALGGPVYLHCASSNRVGASWALYHAERLGFSDEEALAIGREAGLAGLESTVVSILDSN